MKTRERNWFQRYDELCEYKRTHGNCLVPQKYEKNRSLGLWIKKQRANYRLFQEGKRSSMTDERIMMLEKVGFVWNATPEDWGARYEELKRYHQKHGHCLVPQQYAASPSLGIWVNHQRTQYKLYSQNKSSYLNAHRIRMLEELNFQWSAVDAKWMTRFAELRAHVHQHGWGTIPDKKSNPTLHQWIRYQRKQYRRKNGGSEDIITTEQGGLPRDRQELLDSLGFPWYDNEQQTSRIHHVLLQEKQHKQKQNAVILMKTVAKATKEKEFDTDDARGSSGLNDGDDDMDSLEEERVNDNEEEEDSIEESISSKDHLRESLDDDEDEDNCDDNDSNEIHRRGQKRDASALSSCSELPSSGDHKINDNIRRHWHNGRSFSLDNDSAGGKQSPQAFYGIDYTTTTMPQSNRYKVEGQPCRNAPPDFSTNTTSYSVDCKAPTGAPTVLTPQTDQKEAAKKKKSNDGLTKTKKASPPDHSMCKRDPHGCALAAVATPIAHRGLSSTINTQAIASSSKSDTKTSNGETTVTPSDQIDECRIPRFIQGLDPATWLRWSSLHPHPSWRLGGQLVPSLPSSPLSPLFLSDTLHNPFSGIPSSSSSPNLLFPLTSSATDSSSVAAAGGLYHQLTVAPAAVPMDPTAAAAAATAAEAASKLLVPPSNSTSIHCLDLLPKILREHQEGEYISALRMEMQREREALERQKIWAAAFL